MDNFQEQLACSRVEDEDGAIDRLCCQIAFKGLVDRDSVDIGIIDKQLDLVAEKLRVILRVQELLVALGCIKLQTLSNTFP